MVRVTVDIARHTGQQCGVTVKHGPSRATQRSVLSSQTVTSNETSNKTLFHDKKKYF